VGSSARRTDREKESAGIPDIPNSGRLIELEYAAISDRKIRGQLRNPGDIEKTARLHPCMHLQKPSALHPTAPDQRIHAVPC
jgi:hypothetical protein